MFREDLEGLPQRSLIFRMAFPIGGIDFCKTDILNRFMKSRGILCPFNKGVLLRTTRRPLDLHQFLLNQLVQGFTAFLV